MTPEVAEQIKDEELAELTSDFREPLVAIHRELEHQRQKWGKDKSQSLPGFLLILENELAEAKHGWTKNLEGRNSPLSEVVQIAAVPLACLVRYGTSDSAVATTDITEAEVREMKRLASAERAERTSRKPKGQAERTSRKAKRTSRKDEPKAERTKPKDSM